MMTRAEMAATAEPVARLAISRVEHPRADLFYVEVACPHGQKGAFWLGDVPASLLPLVELLLRDWRRDAADADDECDTARVRDYVAQLRW
jgi:hypothetical protein